MMVSSLMMVKGILSLFVNSKCIDGLSTRLIAKMTSQWRSPNAMTIVLSVFYSGIVKSKNTDGQELTHHEGLPDRLLTRHLEIDAVC